MVENGSNNGDPRMMPQDFEGGVQDMLDAWQPDTYEELTPLAQRGNTEIKVKSGDGGDSDAAMALKYGYSAPITQISRLAQKLYGFMRDASVEDPIARSAIKGTNALNNFLMGAPCLNRQGRWDAEEEQATRWQRLIDADRRSADKVEDSEGNEVDPSELMSDILRRWSTADATMGYARIYEELHGIEASMHLHDDYGKAEEAKDKALRDAATLPPNHNMLLWCRIRQYEIMRERRYDLAMGYRTQDVTDIKRKIADGADIHDLASDMLWPFQESYQGVMASMMDGKAHRTLLTALMAQQVPNQQQPPMMPYGMSPWNMYGGPAAGMEGEEEGDKRKAFLNIGGLFGKGNDQAAQQAAQQQQRPRRRANRGRARSRA